MRLRIARRVGGDHRVAECCELHANGFAEASHAAGYQCDALFVLCHFCHPPQCNSMDPQFPCLSPTTVARVARAYLSTAIATPMPPPMQSDARPFLASRR